MASGIPPMAAWTVAFGIYAIMQNVRSFLFKPVFKRQKNTPTIRNTSTPKIKITAANPADSAYLIFTVAPTRTNSIISETTHSLLNLTDKRSATLFRFFWSVIPTAITAINEANGITSASWSSNVTRMNETHRKIITLAVSRICTFSKNFAIRYPTVIPTTIPNPMETGIFTKLFTDIAFPCARPVNAVNKTITKTSSTEAPARINWGILFPVP